MSTALVAAPSGPLTDDEWKERRRLFRQAIMKNGDEAQVDVLLAICKAHGFDPLLGHVDLIDGKQYVTHKGLLHVAHRSGQLDGIVLEAQGETNTHYTARVAVYRRDMNHPFTYTGRYPKQGRNARYGPEMAITRAECLALRRAFDVALSVVEEFDNDGDAARPTPARPRVEVVEATAVETAPREPAALPAGDGADLSWTDFWHWARALGYSDRATLDRVAGRETHGLTPGEIRALIERKTADGTIGVQEGAAPEPPPFDAAPPAEDIEPETWDEPPAPAPAPASTAPPARQFPADGPGARATDAQARTIAALVKRIAPGQDTAPYVMREYGAWLGEAFGITAYRDLTRAAASALNDKLRAAAPKERAT